MRKYNAIHISLKLYLLKRKKEREINKIIVRYTSIYLA